VLSISLQPPLAPSQSPSTSCSDCCCARVSVVCGPKWPGERSPAPRPRAWCTRMSNRPLTRFNFSVGSCYYIHRCMIIGHGCGNCSIILDLAPGCGFGINCLAATNLGILLREKKSPHSLCVRSRRLVTWMNIRMIQYKLHFFIFCWICFT